MSNRGSKDRIRFHSSPELREHFKKEAAYLKHTLDKFGNAILQKLLIYGERTPNGLHVNSFDIDINTEKPKSKSKTLLSLEFKEVWNVLKWQVRNAKVKGWVTISKETVLSSIENLYGIIDGIPKKYNYDDMNCEYKEAFEIFYQKIEDTKKEGWTTTSKKEAIKRVKILKDVAGLK